MMENLNRVTIVIHGTEYTLMTDEDPARVEELGTQLDKKVREVLDQSDRITFSDAAILCAMDYLNLLDKADQSADNMRVQIKEYLEDVARSKIEIEELKRQIDKQKRENAILEAKLKVSDLEKK